MPSEPDLSFLESLLGYNARRVALLAIERFLLHMKPYGLRPVEFSVLSVIRHNPGVTSRQVCKSLGLQAPNLVALVAKHTQAGRLERSPSQTDKRAQELRLSAAGEEWMARAENEVAALEASITASLSGHELATLLALLQQAQRNKPAAPPAKKQR